MRRTLTGAWIETRIFKKSSEWYCRTLTGAWIETNTFGKDNKTQEVAPSRVRELKQLKHSCQN